MYCAFLVPLFDKIKLSKKGMVGIILVYLLYEIAYYYKIGVDNKLIDTTFYYLIPYGTLSYFGYNYRRFNNNTKKIIIICAAILFFSLFSFYWIYAGQIQLVSISKYPPRIYYLSYGLMCSYGLLMLCENHSLNKYSNKFIVFVSNNSMWIYLWHILILDVYSYLGLPKVWEIEFVLVYTASIIATYIMKKIKTQCCLMIQKERYSGLKIH